MRVLENYENSGPNFTADTEFAMKIKENDGLFLLNGCMQLFVLLNCNLNVEKPISISVLLHFLPWRQKNDSLYRLAPLIYYYYYFIALYNFIL